MKKVLALALALMLVLSLSVSAFATATTIHEEEQAALAEGTDHGSSTAAVVGKEGLFTTDSAKQYMVEDANGDTHTVVLGVDGQIEKIDNKTSEDEGWDALLAAVTAGAKVLGEANSYTAETEFWLNVDKDASSTGTETHGEAKVEGTSFVYLIDYTTTTNSNISVTVPLYVCMYGYGGDGKVVVPTQDMYKIKNASTFQRSTKVSAITEYAEWSDDLFEQANVTIKVEQTGATGTDPNTGLDYNTNYAIASRAAYQTLVAGKSVVQVDAINALIVTALNRNEQVDNKGEELLASFVTGGYGFYVKNKLVAEPEGKYEPVSAFADGKMYVKTDFTNTDGSAPWNESGTYVSAVYKPDDLAFNKTATALGVDVVTLKAKEPGTWKIVSANTQQSALLAKQFTLTVNSVDLYNVLHADGSMLDISNLQGWHVAGASELPLPITSSIAGGSVNDDAHTNVLNVAYTIVPEPFE